MKRKIFKRKTFRKTGTLLWKEFSRKQVADWIREYRKNGKAIRYNFPDKSRIYQFEDKNNPYSIAISQYFGL